MVSKGEKKLNDKIKESRIKAGIQFQLEKLEDFDWEQCIMCGCGKFRICIEQTHDGIPIESWPVCVDCGFVGGGTTISPYKIIKGKVVLDP